MNNEITIEEFKVIINKNNLYKDSINEIFNNIKEENIDYLDNNIAVVKSIISNYDINFIENLGYKDIVKNILTQISNKKNVGYEYIKVLAKEYNEKYNRHLIIEEPKIKKWTFAWFISIFTGKNTCEINTAEHEKEEKKLIEEFNIINDKLVNYLREINKLEAIVVNEKYNLLANKLFSYNSIHEDLRKILNDLNKLRDIKNEIKENFKNEDIHTEIEVENNTKMLEENSSINDSISIVESNLDENNSIIEEESLEEKNYYDELAITEVFNENVFKIFIKHCQENELTIISQLKNFDFNELDKIRGFGVAKKEKLIQRYNDVINGNYMTKVSNEVGNDEDLQNKQSTKEITVDILDCYKKLDISVLECFNKINSNLIKEIKKCGINAVDQLYVAIHKEDLIIPGLGATKIKNIIKALEKFKLEPERLFRELIDTIKDNQDYIILSKRAVDNNTLQQIGNEYNVTRESIRQKEKRAINSIAAILNIFIKLQDTSEIKLSTVSDIIGISSLDDEEECCLNYVLKNTEIEGIEYYSEIDKFLVNSNLEELKISVNNFINSLPDCINITEELEDYFITNIELSLLTLDDITKLMLTLGYKQVNEYLFRGSVSKTKIYNFVVKEFFKEGITFSNEDDVVKLKTILKEKFDLEENSLRSIKARVETYSILCDRGSYIHPDLVNFDEFLLDEIGEFINNSTQETLYTHQIFSEFEEELTKAGITNRYYLHGVLGYYFKGTYKFTKDTVYRGNIKNDRKYIFDKYIKDKGRAVTKEEMENDLKGWTPIMFVAAVDECKYVLKWDKGGMIHASLIKVSLEDVDRIKEELNNMFSDNRESITDNDVFETLTPKFKEFFENNSIDNKFKLFSVLEYILGKDYYFRRPYILREKPKEAVSAVYLMKKLFKNNSSVTMDELKEFCFKIKLNDVTRMNSINKLLKDTIEIEKDTFILKENFEIEDSDVEDIEKILLNKIKEKGYLALKSIDDYSDFPNISLKWNEYLLKDICENYIPKVKQLKRQFNDKRYSSPVIVEEDSNMNELLDLIISILKSEFANKKTIEISELENYLQANNIIYEKIPFEIYNCEDIVIEDNVIKM